GGTMRRVMAAVIVVWGLGSASAFASSLEVRLGSFFPKADSLLFKDDADLYDTRKGDWAGFSGGVEFAWRASRNIEMGVHLDGYITAGGKYLAAPARDMTEDFHNIRINVSGSSGTIGVLLRF